MTSRDPAASYYDLTLPDGTRTEVWSVLRAVLTEEEALGYVKACILTRIMRDGQKPDVDRLREVEKVAVETGMLREAMAAHLATPDPMVAALDAVDSHDPRECAARIEDLERERDSLQDTLTGWHDRALDAERQLDEARARIAELERERDEARNLARRFQSAMDEEITRNADARATLETERKASIATAEELERVRAELAGVVDPEQLQRWRTALSASPTETLTNAICRVTSELAALRDRYRRRRQSEEPAPDGEVVLVRAPNRRGWNACSGRGVKSDEFWTHQPPAPEAEREGE